MSKVSNELFLGSETEEVAELLASDPEYMPWSEELEEQLQKEFEDTDKPAF